MSNRYLISKYSVTNGHPVIIRRYRELWDIYTVYLTRTAEMYAGSTVFPCIQYYLLSLDLCDPTSPFSLYITEREMIDSIYKADWYSRKQNTLSLVIGEIGKHITVLCLLDIIGSYAESIHSDDRCEELLVLSDSGTKWVIKGFITEYAYIIALKASKKYWHKTRNLAKRYGCLWRWKRHMRACDILNSLN
jgi:hypothetical protein